MRNEIRREREGGLKSYLNIHFEGKEKHIFKALHQSHLLVNFEKFCGEIIL